MPDFKRVKDNETGHEYSARRPNPNKVTVLDKPAVNANGRPLEPKPNVSAAGRGKQKKSGSEPSGTDTKENTE